jgi:hypothetical protein
MAFHVRITLADIHPQPSRSVITIGETILIKGGATLPLILTSEIERAFEEICFELTDDDKEEEKVHD